jgi:hypothetical protein
MGAGKDREAANGSCAGGKDFKHMGQITDSYYEGPAIEDNKALGFLDAHGNLLFCICLVHDFPRNDHYYPGGPFVWVDHQHFWGWN